MIRLLFFIVIIAMGMARGYSQSLVQTYTDRCTGQTYVFSVPMNGTAVVAFYNKSRTFTAQQFTNGELEAWLEETYTWWQTLSPCSTNTATSQTTQQTTNNATSSATNAAANATSSATQTTGTTGTTGTTSTTNTSSTNTSSTNTNTNGTSSGNNSTQSSSSNSSSPPDNSSSSTSNDSSSSSPDNTSSDSTSGSGDDQSSNSSNESSSNSDGETQTEGENGNNDSNEGNDTSSDQEENSTDSESQESESESEEVEETTEEETTEESSEEESSEEESTEEESTEEEKEEEQEEESEEEESKEEEEEESDEEQDKKEEKRKRRNPINVSANLLTQSSLDSSISNAMSIGLSQSSLTGTTTYSGNLMIWDNLNQFSLSASQSDVYFNYDREEKLYLRNPETGNKDLYFGSYYTKGSIMMVQSLSASFMYIYGTKVVSFGLSNVYMGQKDNAWKGFVGGYALSGTIININDDIMIMPSGVLFGTKPFPTKRVTISPMVALAFNPVSYTFSTKKSMFKGDTEFSKDITYILGSNFDLNISQRFKFNIGGNVIGTTTPGIPLTWSATIGSKFQF